MPEVTPIKAKKPCKLGGKCKKRHCKFDNPSAGAACDDNHETSKRGGDNTMSSTPTRETSCQPDDSICLPLNVSVLLQSLTKTNAIMIGANAFDSSMISKLQSENAQLMNVAQSTRRDLQLLQEQVVVYLEQ